SLILRYDDASVPLSFPTRRSSDLEHPTVTRPQLGHVAAAEIHHPDVGPIEGHTLGEVPNAEGPEHGAVAGPQLGHGVAVRIGHQDRKSTRLNSSHQIISYAVFCLN